MQQMWQVRELIALSMLAICAYTDIRERCIYVMPLIICSAGALALSAVSYVFSPGRDNMILIEEIVLPLAAGLLIIGLVKLWRRHMGEGDGYLMAALCLIIGIRYDLCTIAAGFLLALAYAVITLVVSAVNRKRRCRSIPFAPFIMSGYILVLINGI